jgi:hypothetical protein
MKEHYFSRITFSSDCYIVFKDFSFFSNQGQEDWNAVGTEGHPVGNSLLLSNARKNH